MKSVHAFGLLLVWLFLTCLYKNTVECSASKEPEENKAENSCTPEETPTIASIIRDIEKQYEEYLRKLDENMNTRKEN